LSKTDGVATVFVFSLLGLVLLALVRSPAGARTHRLTYTHKHTHTLTHHARARVQVRFAVNACVVPGGDTSVEEEIQTRQHWCMRSAGGGAAARALARAAEAGCAQALVGGRGFAAIEGAAVISMALACDTFLPAVGCDGVISA
jgi:hypothetical protein